jgi:serine/threonine protein kinase
MGEDMIGKVISHYRILHKIGEGGMGVVYVAEDTLLGRRVAIKTLAVDPDKQHYRARFLREARSVSMLSHPNIAAVYDFGETPDGHPFIVMELIAGQTLGDLLARGELSLTNSVGIIEKTAEALAEAHHRGVVHRDIKPTNIAISDRGEIKVLDFGLAKQLHGDIDESDGACALPVTQTREGVVIGTPLYLSPEQALGVPVDTRSDIFSLGSLLYECLAGRPAFDGTSAIDICAKVIRDDPPPPSNFNPSVPPELNRITLKALAKKPENRYQSADELIAELRALQPSLSDSDHTRAPRKRPPADPRRAHTSTFLALADTLRKRRVFAVAFLTTLAAALFIVWSITSPSRVSPREPPPVAQSWYEKGVAALRNGSYYTASKMLQEAVKADDSFALAHARLAEAMSELDYADGAKDEIIRVGQLIPDRSKLPELDALYLQAITDTVTRNFTAAAESYRKIEQLVPDDARAAAAVDTGRAYEKNEDLDKAVECYLEATRREPQYATAFLRLGVAYARKGEYKNAEAAFDEAQRLYRSLGDLEGETEVLHQRGSMLNKLRDIGRAREQLTQALDKARANGNLSQQILVLLQMSGVSFGAGKIEQAQQQAAEAVSLARANGMENLTTRGLIDFGNAFLSAGNYVEAEKHYAQALEFAQMYKGRRNEARARFMLASSLHNRGKINEALPYVEQAYNFYQQGGYRRETVQALMLLGRANRDRGDYDAALRASNQHLQHAEQVNDRALVAFSHKEIGTILALSERYPEALRHFERSSLISDQLGDKEATAYNSVLRADMLWRLGRFDEARDVLAKVTSNTGSPGGGFQSLAAHAHVINAGLELSALSFQPARAESEKAIEMTAQRSDHMAIDALCVLGLAQAHSGTARAGVKSCREAVTASERTGDEWRLSASSLALAETLLLSGDAKGALTSAERAREGFERRGQRESLWRAWLLAARASHLLKDGAKALEHADRAAEYLWSLQEHWGKDAYEGYLTRPDVQRNRRQLVELLSVGP